MNYKTIIKTSLLVFIIISLNACAFIPKTIKASTKEKMACDMVTSEWDIEVVALGDFNNGCHNEACVGVYAAVPIVTAVISLPIVLIGNSIHFVEKQLRCH